MGGEETSSCTMVDSSLFVIVEPYFVQVFKFLKSTVDLVDTKCDAVFINGIVLSPVRLVDSPVVVEDDDSLMIIGMEVVVIGGNNDTFVPMRAKRSSSCLKASIAIEKYSIMQRRREAILKRKRC